MSGRRWDIRRRASLTYYLANRVRHSWRVRDYVPNDWYMAFVLAVIVFLADLAWLGVLTVLGW